MKRKLASNSGLTLIEIIAALVILVIMVAGFATVFSFAGTSVFISARDSVANADSRTETDTLLAGPIGAGTDVQVDLNWNEGHAGQTVATTRESTDVPISRGPDGSFDLYRRPRTLIPPEITDPREIPYIHNITYDFNGGFNNQGYTSVVTIVHAGSMINPYHNHLTHPDGLRFSHWLITNTGEIYVFDYRNPFDIHESLYLLAIWV